MSARLLLDNPRGWLIEQYNRKIRAVAQDLRDLADIIERNQLDPDTYGQPGTPTAAQATSRLFGQLTNLLPNLALGQLVELAADVDGHRKDTP